MRKKFIVEKEIKKKNIIISVYIDIDGIEDNTVPNRYSG